MYGKWFLDSRIQNFQNSDWWNDLKHSRKIESGSSGSRFSILHLAKKLILIFYHYHDIEIIHKTSLCNSNSKPAQTTTTTVSEGKYCSLAACIKAPRWFKKCPPVNVGNSSVARVYCIQYSRPWCSHFRIANLP